MWNNVRVQGNLKHDLKQLQSIDDWNMDHILDRCVEIFAQMQYSNNHRNRARAIYPNPIYMTHSIEAQNRRAMFDAGRHCNLYNDGTELHIACHEGNWGLFMQLIKTKYKHYDFNQSFVGVSEWSILNYVLDGRRYFVVNKETSKQFKNVQNQFKHLEIAQYMIDNGLDVNIQNKYGYTVLNEAVINVPDVRFVAFLLKNDANPDIYNIFCGTALMECTRHTNVECTKLLCKYNANPLLRDFQGYQILDGSSARNHIEISTIINNRIRKTREQVSCLEYEDPNYCFVCNVSNKQCKLLRCQRCKSAERYCSKRCQKLDWHRHKQSCRKNGNKLIDWKQKQFVVNVEYCSGNLVPTWKAQTGQSEFISKHLYGSDPIYESKSVVIEDNHEEYRKKRMKKLKKECHKMMRSNDNGKNGGGHKLYPPQGIKVKMIIKIQIFPTELTRKWMLCYEKSRKYKVFIFKKKQKRKYERLYTLILRNGMETNEAKKGYFYAFVDKNKKLHIFHDMIAAQPW